MGWLEDVLYGAISQGLNGSTWVTLNVLFLALVAALSWFLFLSNAPSASPAVREVAPHLAAMLCMAVVLVGLVNWLALQPGVRVTAEAQRRELGLDQPPAGSADSSQAEKKPAATDAAAPAADSSSKKVN